MNRKLIYPLAISAVVIAVVGSGAFLYRYFSRSRTPGAGVASAAVSGPLRVFSASELGEFNGANSQKPIYLGLNGKVYDVSAGRDFYEVGGPYHYLAGRDSSAELNQIGGDIIVSKYPVIGELK